MNEKKQPLYKIGDLIVEIIDGLDLSTGLITEIKYDPLDKDYIYSIMWNDMGTETEIFESIIEWRIENEVYTYYKVVT